MFKQHGKWTQEQGTPQHKGPHMILLAYMKSAVGIDIISRMAFPMAFLLFNVIYWLYYST